MAIVLRRFKGVRPRASPRLLAYEEATAAVNVKLWNGKLRPYKRAKFEFEPVTAGPILSIFRYRGGGKEGWLSWDVDVDVVRAPLAGDDFGRIYFTGDGKPKVTDSTMALLLEREAAGNVNAGEATILIEGPHRGFVIGDTLTIAYAAGSPQTVTVTSVTPSSANLLIGVTPTLSGNLVTGDIVTNISGRLPLDAYELGVPAPATALTTTAASGPGVTTGTILAVEDIVVTNHTATQDTGLVGDYLVGSGPAFAPMTTATTFSATTDGQPMEFVMRTTFAVRIKHSNETRNMVYSLYLVPDIGDDELLFSTSTNIVRPAGSPQDWVYEVASDGIHVPTPGTYDYRAVITPIAGLAVSDSESINFDVTVNFDIRVRYTNRIRLLLNTGHGLVVGNRITLHISRTESTPIDRELDGRVVEIVAVSGDYVHISALPGGIYNTVGATWTQSTGTDEELVSRSYTYTYVAAISGQEFEGAPAPASAVIDVADGQPVSLTGFINPTSPLLRDTNFIVLRIYRFQPDGAGGGAYLFLSEQPLTTTNYSDTVPGTLLGEVLPSDGWELPPDNLAGLIELPEGGAAGFTDKELCFAVPYQLHAYPAAYRRTTHDRIVALGAFGSSIVAVTDGTPYVFTGTDPLTMTSERLEIIQPCMSKRGMVDVGYAVIYPSPEGLMLISIGRADVVTGDWFTSDEWRHLNPASFVATRYGQRYLCFYDATSLVPTWPKEGFTNDIPVTGGFIFDPKEGTFVFLDFHATEAWTDPKDDTVYIVQDDVIRKFDADRLELDYRWRSKPFHTAIPIPMAYAKIEALSYPVKFTAFADGQVKWVQLVRDANAFRLPDGMHYSWAVEVQSVSEVDAVFVASSADEMKEVAGGM